MKKIIIGLLVIFSGLFLSGCQAKKTVIDPTVTKIGVIQAKSDDSYVFNSSGELINITSTKYSLDDYFKKNISVTGQYSGDTLYVNDLVEIQ